MSYRALPAEGIDAFLGIGVFYGAARTEAAAMRGRDVILVGGGNSAGQAAAFFADYAAKVTILIRGAGLEASMSRYLIDELERKPNVEVRTGGEIAAFAGDERLERVTIRNRADGSLDEVDATPCSSSSAPTPTPAGCPSSSCATSAATSAPAATSPT